MQEHSTNMILYELFDKMLLCSLICGKIVYLLAKGWGA